MILAIDPGHERSAWLTYDPATREPREWGMAPNEDVLDRIEAAVDGAVMARSSAVDTFDHVDRVAVEMIASYGMAVGAEVFATCVWIGRFVDRWVAQGGGTPPLLVFRREVKLHLCGSMRAKDSNVRAALIDRYGPGKDKAVGRKASPGPLYGVKADVWSALAVAITAAETKLPDGHEVAA